MSNVPSLVKLLLILIPLKIRKKIDVYIENIVFLIIIVWKNVLSLRFFRVSGPINITIILDQFSQYSRNIYYEKKQILIQF